MSADHQLGDLQIGETLPIARAEAIKELETVRQYPRMYTFHPTIVKATSITWIILNDRNPNSRSAAALTFAAQIAVIFKKHAADMLIESHIPHREYLGFNNKIAMIGLCFNQKTEFYPIKHQLWDEDNVLTAKLTHPTIVEQKSPMVATRDYDSDGTSTPTPGQHRNDTQIL